MNAAVDHEDMESLPDVRLRQAATGRSKLSYARIVVERLTKSLRPVSEELLGDAAVALILRVEDQDLKTLVVKRVEKRGDPWSGQMALPGGRRERIDADLKQTAIRETLEETGIDLHKHSRFLGVLEDVSTVVRPEMRITPFVALLEKKPIIKLEDKELEDYMWVSPQELAKHRSTAKFSFGEFPAYVVEDKVIWGLTYRILTDFLKIIA